MLRTSDVYWTVAIPFYMQQNLEQLEILVDQLGPIADETLTFQSKIPDFSTVEWKYTVSTFSALTESRYRSLLKMSMDYYEEIAGRPINFDEVGIDSYSTLAETIIFYASGVSAITKCHYRMWDPVVYLDGPPHDEDPEVPWFEAELSPGWYEPSWALENIAPDLLRALGLESQALNGRFFFSQKYHPTRTSILSTQLSTL